MLKTLKMPKVIEFWKKYKVKILRKSLKILKIIIIIENGIIIVILKIFFVTNIS